MTVTWKEFSLKSVTPKGGACAAPAWGALGVTPASRVSTPSLFAKPASVQPLGPTRRPAAQSLDSASAGQGSRDSGATGVSRAPLISPTAKAPATSVTQPELWTPVWAIANASFMLKVLRVVSANHYIGIWPKKTLMDAQNADATWREP